MLQVALPSHLVSVTPSSQPPTSLTSINVCGSDFSKDMYGHRLSNIDEKYAEHSEAKKILGTKY